MDFESARSTCWSRDRRSSHTLLLGALAVVLLAAFITTQGRARNPMFDTAGLFVLGRLGPRAHYFPDVMIAFVLIGLGAGLAFMPLLTIAMANVPRADAGIASDSGALSVGAAIIAA